jgi:secreted trypsin-like serine protease
MSKLAIHAFGMGILALASCADAPLTVSSREAAIVGGTTTTVGEYPNVVALSIGGALCTGTLIAPNVVLTAAHCVEPSELQVGTQEEVTAQTRVVFDRTDLRVQGGFIVSAKSTLPKADFDIGNLGQHDIGVVVLSERVKDRAPANIIRDAAAVPAGSKVTLVGYGISSVTNGLADQGSAGTEFQLVDKGTIDCALLQESNADLLCFDQRDGKGSCNGDSGGPAFTSAGGKLVVAGVTSFGDQECIQIGAYTRVTAELAFVEEQMKLADACAADGVCTPACGAGSLAADPDCGSSPPPSSTPGTSDPDSGNPPGSGNTPAVGGAPGLTGGCTVAPGHSPAAGGLAALALLLLGSLSRIPTRRNRG